MLLALGQMLDFSDIQLSKNCIIIIIFLLISQNFGYIEAKLCLWKPAKYNLFCKFNITFILFFLKY